jgi:hypothetical protein
MKWGFSFRLASSSTPFRQSDRLDRAQLAPECSPSNLVTSGSIENKLTKYFEPSCFTTPPIIGADIIGTAFGNSRTGIVDGPAQSNIDVGITRSVPISLLKEGSNLSSARSHCPQPSAVFQIQIRPTGHFRSELSADVVKSPGGTIGREDNLLDLAAPCGRSTDLRPFLWTIN